MGSESLADRLADQLLDQVVRGELAVDEALPSEGEIAAQAGVSRLTVREAVKVLRTKNIVRVKRGRGTYVNAPDQWTDLELVLRLAGRRSGSSTAALGLLEAQRILETGAAELCAQRRSEADLALLGTHVAEMDKAVAEHDAAAFVRAELAFHSTVLRSCGNVFVPAMCGPLERMLLRLHTRAAHVVQVRRRTLRHHRRILAEITAGSPAAARAAMNAHLEQTAEDLLRHGVGGAADSAPAARGTLRRPVGDSAR
ncbi:FadR/GntR family transcriptional regulator [Thermobifida cellulosilytica]|uniref:GntR family transcriptional regulator n=1 Tax=Thermobifida cellulosilytica TB100 TaxID=665004 RepID=A0A147KF96_THECS|nr:FCD domain-containing protein [Thermobifida cellulosilytica]KUP95981.1 GntR family transcriptional regulator [Thermobifida cellulosilytica TB100]